MAGKMGRVLRGDKRVEKRVVDVAWTIFDDCDVWMSGVDE